MFHFFRVDLIWCVGLMQVWLHSSSSLARRPHTCLKQRTWKAWICRNSSLVIVQHPQPHSSVFPTVACHLKTRSLSGTLLLHSYSFRDIQDCNASRILCLHLTSFLLLESNMTPKMLRPSGLKLKVTGPEQWSISISPRSEVMVLCACPFQAVWFDVQAMAPQPLNKARKFIGQLLLAVREDDQIVRPSEYI